MFSSTRPNKAQQLLLFFGFEQVSIEMNHSKSVGDLAQLSMDLFHPFPPEAG